MSSHKADIAIPDVDDEFNPAKSKSYQVPNFHPQ